MNSQFTLSCCSTVDLPYAHLVQRQVPVLFYTYVVDGQEYVDDMGRDPEACPGFTGFYRREAPPDLPDQRGYLCGVFEQQLQKGDLLHIAFTSGQSGSVNNAYIAAETLREKYPERKIQVIDSLCSSSGYGLLVDEAADLRDAGEIPGGDRPVGAGEPQQGTPSVLLLRHDPVPADGPGIRRGGHGGHGAEYLPHHAPERRGAHHRLRKRSGARKRPWP